MFLDTEQPEVGEQNQGVQKSVALGALARRNAMQGACVCRSNILVRKMLSLPVRLSMSLRVF